ncbi:DnaJ-like protein subfamily C member 19 [Nematocida sp. AWRm80]|nr:DnaJ-like protein subfamily C member 19 [Nematocida sp. AWRm80]
MTLPEALKILNLPSVYSPNALTNYKKILLKNHPDSNGSEYIAQKINEARDLILKKREDRSLANRIYCWWYQNTI